MNGLARVNLLVGPNNVGKTTLLEAAELLGAAGRVGVWARSAQRRGEYHDLPVDDDLEPGRRGGGIRGNSFSLNLNALFPAWEAEVGRVVRVSDGLDGDIVQAEVVEDSPDSRPPGQGLRPLALRLTGPAYPVGKPMIAPLGGPWWDERYSNALRGAPNDGPPAVFISGNLPTTSRLRADYDAVAGNAEEAFVVDALRILVPDLERVHVGGPGSAPSAFLRRRGEDQRRPLGSFGDGTRRILGLALSLAKARGGVLLIDEVDSGLFHTTLQDVWRWLVLGASRLNVQVFATTHSRDCLSAVAAAHRSHPALDEDVAVFRVSRALDEAVRYSPSAVETALDQGEDPRT